MSLVRAEDWNEDDPRFERIRKDKGKVSFNNRTLRRVVDPTPRMMRMCSGKHSYQRGNAERVAGRASERSGLVIGAYRCPYCGRYHVGGTPWRLRSIAEMEWMG